MTYDAILVLSFGGPDGPDDVRPFLARVTRGRDVPAARLDAVARRYDRLGGVSPINAANRALVRAIGAEVDVPVYWGNRNWHPLVEDTVRAMASDGVRHAACIVTSAYSGYSACRQYVDDIARARRLVGDAAPVIDKLRPYYDHPGFIEPMVENVAAALRSLDPSVRPLTHLAFTAHSVPLAQPAVATYSAQVAEASRLVADRVAGAHPWSVSWQSRSGPPTQPWLEPDVDAHLGVLAGSGVGAVVVVPIGFVADHMEVVYDLDIEARDRAAELGLAFARAATVGVAPAFVRMVAELIAERTDPTIPARALGRLGPPTLDCSGDCCAT
ncbi:MAG: ferrochelatase [Acidimicrobiales bacterium]